MAEDEVMDEAVEKGPDSDDRWNEQLGPDFGAKVWGVGDQERLIAYRMRCSLDTCYVCQFSYF